jgi:integral membrane sensor domain MASE1
MRRAARIRTAELKARRFFDFVSPALLGAAVAAYVGATVLLLFLGQRFLIRHQFLITYLPSVMTVCNVGLAGCAVWLLYGRKQNPHQSHGDRARMIRLGWQRTLVASILLSVLVGIMSALFAFRLVDYIPLATSLYIQINVVIWTGVFFVVVPFGQESFEAYRADPNRGAALATNSVSGPPERAISRSTS